MFTSRATTELPNRLLPCAIESVEVARGTSEGGVERVASLVDGHEKAPVVGAGAIFPFVAGPGFMAGSPGRGTEWNSHFFAPVRAS